MTKPLFTDTEKTYLAKFLGGVPPHPTTPFEARATLERAALNAPDSADGRLVRATFAEWADELEPQPNVSPGSHRLN